MFHKSRHSRFHTRLPYRKLNVQPLEPRMVLAASVGWDGPGLGSAELTYYIANNPNSLSSAQTTAAIEKALNVWSSVADITFTRTNQRGLRDSIDISFVNIDGAARTLAQAYFPDDVNPARIAGDVQFDSSETWEVGNSRGSRAFDLVWVAVHEIGHSLGLSHLNAAGSVLAPFASPNQQFVSLSAADRAAILRLYAASDGSTAAVGSGATASLADNSGDTGDTGDTDDNPFPQHRWRRGGNWQRFGERLDADGPQNFNFYNPTDVNGDSYTSAIDVLRIINYLNQGSPTDSQADDIGLCDTNGDGSISAIDALTVINVLNSAGTDASPRAVSSDASGGDSSADCAVDKSTTGSADDSDSTDASDTGASNCKDEVGTQLARRNGGLRYSSFGLVGPTAEQLVERYDKNTDGDLAEDEVPAKLWELFVDRSVDADADGLVSLTELQTAFTAARQEYFTSKDTDSDGLLTESELGSRLWNKLEEADADASSGVSFVEFETWIANRSTEIASLRHQHRHQRVDAVFERLARALGR